MVKLICLINRPQSVSKEKFKEWWLEHHSKVAAKLPNLRRYTISTTQIKPEEADSPFDGVAELWFDSHEAMQESFASKEGQEVSREDKEFIERRIVFVTKEYIIL